MGKLSTKTRSMFEKARKSLRLAAEVFRAGDQERGLHELAADLEHFVLATESAFMEVKGELNQLESKLDRRNGPPTITKINGWGLVGSLTLETGMTIPIKLTLEEQKGE